MELKLNIKKRGQVIKTYTTNTYDIPLGVCEDLINLIGIERFVKEGDSEEITIPVGEIITIVVQNLDTFKELLHDIFPELTEEERRQVSIFDLRDFFIELAKDAFTRLFNFSRKN